MKKIAAIVFVLCMSGCGAFQKGCSEVTGEPTEICIDGIVYLQFTSGACVKVDAEGKPVKCK